MELCSSGHDEICFEGRHCPACSIQSELDDANGKIDDLKNRVDDLENQE